MKVRHQSPTTDVTVDAYPLEVYPDGWAEPPVTVYQVRMSAGRGRGGVNEPVVVVEWSARELRDFALDLLSLVAVEESRND